MRLVASGKDLRGTGASRRPLQVTPEQLRLHCTEDDAWMAIRGRVYNITPYFKYHPGGLDVLMRGVGADATDLFNEYHPWVNLETMLRTCMIGTLEQPPRSKEPPKRAKTNGGQQGSSLRPAVPLFKAPAPAKGLAVPGAVASNSNTKVGARGMFVGMTMTTARQVTPDQYVCRFKCAKGGVVSVEPGQHVRVRCNLGRQILIRDYTPTWPLNDEPSSEFEALIKIYPNGELTPHLGKLAAALLAGEEEKSGEKVEPSVMETNEAEAPRTVGSSGMKINVVDLTGRNGAQAAGSKRGALAVSGACGQFNYTRQAGKAKHLGIICAGTGISPFVRIVRRWLGEGKDGRTLRVLNCNRTKQDIPLVEELENWASHHGKGVAVHIANVLTGSSGLQSGPISAEQVAQAVASSEEALPLPREHVFQGRLSQELVESWMWKGDEKNVPGLSVLVCGPPRFNAQTVKYLVQSGFKEAMFHVFA